MMLHEHLPPARQPGGSAENVCLVSIVAVGCGGYSNA